MLLHTITTRENGTEKSVVCSLSKLADLVKHNQTMILCRIQPRGTGQWPVDLFRPINNISLIN